MKYRVIPYLPRINSSDAPKDVASKIETFLNQNSGSNGRSKIEKYAVWVFEDR